MRKLPGFLIALLLCGCAARDINKAQSVRQHFVPAPGKGASWSRLAPHDNNSGVSWGQAWAGIGDTFPVQDENGRKLFELLVATGDDNHLLVEARSTEGAQRIDLQRDKKMPVQIAGAAYELLYPSIYVRAADKPTTSKAMLIVLRRP
jgi:hypothetical protein